MMTSCLAPGSSVMKSHAATPSSTAKTNPRLSRFMYSFIHRCNNLMTFGNFVALGSTAARRCSPSSTSTFARFIASSRFFLRFSRAHSRRRGRATRSFSPGRRKRFSPLALRFSVCLIFLSFLISFVWWLKCLSSSRSFLERPRNLYCPSPGRFFSFCLTISNASRTFLASNFLPSLPRRLNRSFARLRTALRSLGFLTLCSEMFSTL
mmetsp:Transcript_56032/g.144255  ORF Transcript_56032/g.144255 Transcript_56032/m.144255 type:complete len:208 (+) Transcript_56032:600-1223(+)